MPHPTIIGPAACFYSQLCHAFDLIIISVQSHDLSTYTYVYGCLSLFFVNGCNLLYFGLWPQHMTMLTQWLLIKSSPFGQAWPQANLSHASMPDSWHHWALSLAWTWCCQTLVLQDTFYMHERKRDFSSCSWWESLKLPMVC